MRLIFWLLIVPGGIITYFVIGFLCYILNTKILTKINDWNPEYTWRSDIIRGDTGFLWACLMIWWFITPIMIVCRLGYLLNLLFKKIAERV